MKTCYFAVCQDETDTIRAIFDGLKPGEVVRLRDLGKMLGGTVEKLEDLKDVERRHADGCLILRYNYGEPQEGGIGEKTWFDILTDEEVKTVVRRSELTAVA